MRVRTMRNLFIFLFSLLVFPAAMAEDHMPGKHLTITGQVKQPLQLFCTDLAAMRQGEIKLDEVTTDGTYHGSFYYSGVPLKNLLALAEIVKPSALSDRLLDLAIVCRDRKGERMAVLSWGEVFLHNPGDTIVALSAKPAFPTHPSNAGEAGASKPNGAGAFPKLVLARDLYTDRCLEDLARIEVVATPQEQGLPAEKSELLPSPSITVTGPVATPKTLESLDSFSRRTIVLKLVGQHRGYLGVREYSGSPLKEILEQAGVKRDPASAFLITAKDGYRCLVSYGELFLSSYGERIIVADRMKGLPLDRGGRFTLVPADDLWADRFVKSVCCIEAVNFQQHGKLNVISVGCGDPMKKGRGPESEEASALIKKHLAEGKNVVFRAGYENRENTLRTTLAEAGARYKGEWLGLIYVGPPLEWSSAPENHGEAKEGDEQAG